MSTSSVTVSLMGTSAQDADAPILRPIGVSDLYHALRIGWEDFKEVPSHAVILCLIYPVIGLVLARMVVPWAGVSQGRSLSAARCGDVLRPGPTAAKK